MARPRSEEARAKMLATTIELVMDCGVHRFTIDEVARRSGVAKTTIYRHFPTRNELLVAALDGTISPFPSPDTGSFRDDLVDLLDTALPTFVDPTLRPFLLDLLAASARDRELERIHQALVEERMRPLRTIFDRAVARGELPADLDFESAFDFIEGPFVARWLLRPDSLDDIDVATLVDRTVAALAVRPGGDGG